jgi:hypothetical protein
MLGSNSIQAANTATSLAKLLTNAGKYDEAELLLRRRS